MLTIFQSKRSIIRKIHNDFRTASDFAVAEADKIVNGDKREANTAERLQNLGFTSTPKVVKLREDTEIRYAVTRNASVIREYQQKYPTMKFIMEEQVKSLCKKWGLICGPVSYYKGNVPEKNLAEIERNLQLVKREDANNDYDYQWRNAKANSLFICASKKDFDTRNMRVEDGYKLKNIPDPVVLKPVRYGYLILTAWGDEASDENVVNEKMN